MNLELKTISKTLTSTPVTGQTSQDASLTALVHQAGDLLLQAKNERSTTDRSRQQFHTQLRGVQDQIAVRLHRTTWERLSGLQQGVLLDYLEETATILYSSKPSDSEIEDSLRAKEQSAQPCSRYTPTQKKAAIHKAALFQLIKENSAEKLTTLSSQRTYFWNRSKIAKDIEKAKAALQYAELDETDTRKRAALTLYEKKEDDLTMAQRGFVADQMEEAKKNCQLLKPRPPVTEEMQQLALQSLESLSNVPKYTEVSRKEQAIQYEKDLERFSTTIAQDPNLDLVFEEALVLVENFLIRS